MYSFSHKKNLFVVAPIIGGDQISTDNTCKTFVNKKNFTDKIRNELSDVISIHKILLQLDIDVDENNHILMQLDKYLKIVEFVGSLDNNIVHQIMIDNVHGIVLDSGVQSAHVVKHSVNPTFSISHDTNFLGRCLRESMLDLTSVKTSRYTINEFKSSLERIDSNHPDPLSICRKAWIKCNFDDDKWVQVASALQTRIDEIKQYSEDSDEFCKEQLCSILEPIWPSIFPENISFNSFAAEFINISSVPQSQSLAIGISNNISILTQFFLAIVNTYLKDQDKSTENFGVFFENNSYLSARLSLLVKSCLMNGEATEDKVLEFLLTEKIIPRNISASEISIIKKRFYKFYNMIKDSSHFDEFFVLTQEAGTDTATKSPWFNCRGSFSLELCEYASRIIPDDHDLHLFVQEQLVKFANVPRDDDNHINYDSLADICSKKISFAIKNNLIKDSKVIAQILDNLISKIDDECITTLIENIKEGDLLGEKLFLWSLRNIKLDFANILLDRGVYSNINENEKIDLILNLASEMNCSNLMIRLIEEKPELDYYEFMFQLITSRKYDIFMELLKKDYISIKWHRLDETHKKILFNYLMNNLNLIILELFLQNGTDPNTLRIGSKTALHIATENGDASIVELLLQNNADPNLKLLSIKTALYIATENGDASIVELLLQNSADPNLICFGNKTALHIATETGDASIVELLLQNSADPNLRCPYNKTALHIATETGDATIVELLLQNGVDPNLKCFDNKTALHIATETGDASIVELLLQNSADPNLKCFDNKTALHIATETGDATIVELLLQNGANINEIFYSYDNNPSKGTPLQIAIAADNLRLVVSLLNKGAHINKNILSNSDSLVKNKNYPNILKALIARDRLQYFSSLNLNKIEEQARSNNFLSVLKVLKRIRQIYINKIKKCSLVILAVGITCFLSNSIILNMFTISFSVICLFSILIQRKSILFRENILTDYKPYNSQQLKSSSKTKDPKSISLEINKHIPKATNSL